MTKEPAPDDAVGATLILARFHMRRLMVALSVLSLPARVSLVGSVVLGLAVGGTVATVLRDVDVEMERQSTLALDSNLKLLRRSLINEGGSDVFSVADGRLRIGAHIITADDRAVDEVRDIVGGTATIFLGDQRIATNVTKPDGSRATGTRLAQGPAYDALIRQGQPYRGEAEILGTAYLTAYEPIRGADGHMLGILYAGVRKADYQASVHAMQMRALTIGTVLAAFCVLLLWLSIRRALRPLGTLRAGMARIAAGDVTTEIPFGQCRDEIGAMAAAVQVFKDNLIRTRLLETETAQARLATEEQRKIGMRQMADSFEAAVGGIIGLVSSSATELQTTARSLSGIASETANRSTVVAAAAEEAAGNVSTVAAATEELNASVQEIGRQAAGSATLTRTAVAEADQTGALVEELNSAVSRVGDVVTMIADIAGQTNLLALNATIEAARAGEAGRGFAVVAAEVKALALQTAKATGDISGQIARIQSSTGHAAAAIGTITSRIQEVDGVATSIAAAVEEQGAATQEIVRNIMQAATGTGAVKTTIAGVAGAAEGTGAAAAQVLASASELSRQSEHLSAEVVRFLATVRAA